MHAPGQAPDHARTRGNSLSALTLGAIGVVYGDIGTSPLYAFREALARTASGAIGAADIIGVLSLMLWALIVVVTLKYVLFLMRMDNNGEGGVLSLMALASRATAGKWPVVLVLGAAGAALFYGDAIITPALSVLSAVEGLKTVPGLGGLQLNEILLATAAILAGLFAIQSRGTAMVAGLFGPVCAIWFVVLAGLGLWHIAQAPAILAAFNPWYAIQFFLIDKTLAFLALGSVVLAVTGAEALYSDMGHFGRGALRLSWFGFVMPCLLLNYFGQGAMIISMGDATAAQAIENPFFFMAPDMLRLPLVLLATAASFIASSAHLLGFFSR